MTECLTLVSRITCLNEVWIQKQPCRLKLVREINSYDLAWGHIFYSFLAMHIQSKKGSKDQESIQSSTTPEPCIVFCSILL